MNCYDSEPQTITIGKRKYKIHAPYDTVLFIYDCLKNNRMSTQDKTRLACRLLFPHHCWPLSKQVEAVTLALSAMNDDDKKRHTDNGPPVMDLVQDASLIYAAFYQQYGIDLAKVRGMLSWQKFCRLLGGLTNSTVFGQVVEIRARPVPAPNRYNREQRQELLKAKSRVALQLPHDEQKLMQGFAALADRLIAQAKAGDTHV